RQPDQSCSSLWLLPARLGKPGNLAARRDFADLGARETKFAVDTARAAGNRAAVALPGRARIAGQRMPLRLRRQPLFRTRLGTANLFLQVRAHCGVLLRRQCSALVSFDHARLGHARSLRWSSVAHLRNGKLNAVSSARPCALSRAVVVIVISMPRNWSIASYWISGNI